MEQCIFCKIANGQIPSVTLYEDEDFRVIFDLSPASPGHALIIPKQHAEDVCTLDPRLASRVLQVAAAVGRQMKEKLGCSGFNLVQNNGSSAGQTVFHFHMHIIPRYEQGPAMVSWTPQSTDQAELELLLERLGQIPI